MSSGAVPRTLEATTAPAVARVERERVAKSNGWWGMLIFLLSETTLFLMIFGAYYYLRFKTPHWPPRGVPEPKALLPIVLTVVLVSSSVLVQMALRAARDGWVGRVRMLLFGALTIQGGYLAAQIVLFEHDWHDFSPSRTAYASIYFTMLAIHHAHVAMGIALELFLLLRLTAGMTTYRFNGLQATVLYWHFVNALAILVVFTQVSPRL